MKQSIKPSLALIVALATLPARAHKTGPLPHAHPHGGEIVLDVLPGLAVLGLVLRKAMRRS